MFGCMINGLLMIGSDDEIAVHSLSMNDQERWLGLRVVCSNSVWKTNCGLVKYS